MKKQNKKELCACGGLCEGECREEHLHRERDWSDPPDTCPEHYEIRKKHNYKRDV